jgi:CubicO group peptidase (beta-lactamase class C family)
MHKIVTFILALALASSASCQDNTQKKLEELFTFYQKQNLFNGSVLIANKGRILLDSGFGLQNVNLNERNNPKGIFSIYSITKTFTSSHTSGIYDYTRGNTMPDQTEKSFIEFHKTKPLDFPAGSDWNYTNSGYYFLGYIIQKVTGMTYEKAVKKYIFNPLEMTHSGFAFKYLVDKNKAIGYEVFTENTKKEAVVYDPPGPFAAGGIYSTIEDLYKYYEGLKAYKILTKTSLDKACTPFKNNYGYGWVVVPMFDKKTVGHSGAGAGFRTNFVQIPEDDICIILLSNTENDLNNITGDVLKILYNKPFKIPVSIAVPKEILKQYVGTYAVNDNFILYVTLENNKLIVHPSKQPKSVLYPEKENLFYVTELNSYIHFEKNTSNQIDTLIFNREGQDIKAAKINPLWGVIGSATENGWDGTDIKMIETETKGIWTVKNISLKDGEIKFRLNSDWSVNLGLTESKFDKLRQEGENIKIENGVYDIILDLTDDDNPKYKITKQK